MCRILFLAACLYVALLTSCNFSGAPPAFVADNTEADQSAGDDAVASDTSSDQHGPDVVMQDTPTEDTPLEDTPMEDTPLEDTPLEDTPGPDSGVDTIENLCLAAGGTCMIPLPDEDGDGCPDGYSPAGLSGCGDMEICCVPSTTPCVQEGEGFESFETDGMCCPGLVPVPDCFQDQTGGCVCPNCPCYVCTACGNGQCGLGENVCNCPEDCEGPPPDCFGLGGAYNEFETDLTCCPGLTAVPDCFDEGSGCICPGCPCMICTECGDGACGPFENKCNCPEDCDGGGPNDCFDAGGVCEQQCPQGWGPVWLSGCGYGEVCCMPDDDCVPAGGSVAVMPDPEKECCPGLSKIGIFDIDENGECQGLIGGMVCSDCGNGYCEEWESLCSCPEDCPPPDTPPLDCYPAFPDCPDDSYCKLPAGQCYQEGAWGMCTVISDFCAWLYNPVCGCDHETYDNECLMESAQQSMDYPGVCESP